jgi:hypothetical protein
MPEVHVQVQGKVLTMDDIWAFEIGLFKPPPQSPQIKTVQKNPPAMPSDAPYTSYQGRDLGPSPAEIIWES